MTLGNVGYWIAGPKFLKLLNDAVPMSYKIEGEVNNIQFENGFVFVTSILYAGGTSSINHNNIIKAKFLFG